MALVTNDYCRRCGAYQLHTNRQCNKCLERERREALSAFKAKTVEEKLIDLHQRLLKMESGPTRY